MLKLFHRNCHHIETTCREQDLGRYLEGQGHSIPLQKNRVRPITSLFEVWFYNYFTEMITILGWYVARNIWSLPWRSRSQHDLAAKLCPAYNFVNWRTILKLFHRNDHHIETPCREQHLGRYLEGQGHSITLQQKRVRPITLLFEVGFYNYLTEMFINGSKQCHIMTCDMQPICSSASFITIHCNLRVGLTGTRWLYV